MRSNKPETDFIKEFIRRHIAVIVFALLFGAAAWMGSAKVYAAVDLTQLEQAVKDAKDFRTGVRISTEGDGSDVGPKYYYVTSDEWSAFDDAILYGEEVLDNMGPTQSAVDQALQELTDAQAAFEAARKPGKKVLPAIKSVEIYTEGGSHRKQPAAGGIYKWRITFEKGSNLSNITDDDFQIQRKPYGKDWKDSKCPAAMFDKKTAVLEAMAIPDNNTPNVNLWRFSYAGEGLDEFPMDCIITQAGIGGPDDPDDPKPDPEPASKPIYRLYNKQTKEHLWTASKNEYNTLPKYGWTQEGTAWNAPKEGKPVYRLYNPKTKDHHYTSDKNEVNVLTAKHGWTKDNNGKPLFYSGGSKPVYRLYNKKYRVGAHHLTMSEKEYKTLPKYGWKQEGTAMYAVK